MKFKKSIGGIALDFLIMTLLASALCLSVFIARSILFGERTECGTLIFRTEAIPQELSSSLSVGDEIYDCLTKRRVGTLTHLERVYAADSVSFIIEIDATRRPSSDKLRTKELWFRVTPTDKESSP